MICICNIHLDIHVSAYFLYTSLPLYQARRARWPRRRRAYKGQVSRTHRLVKETNRIFSTPRSTCRPCAVSKDITGGPPRLGPTSLRKVEKGDRGKGAGVGTKMSLLSMCWDDWNSLESGQLAWGARSSVVCQGLCLTVTKLFTVPWRFPSIRSVGIEHPRLQRWDGKGRTKLENISSPSTRSSNRAANFNLSAT